MVVQQVQKRSESINIFSRQEVVGRVGHEDRACVDAAPCPPRGMTGEEQVQKQVIHYFCQITVKFSMVLVCPSYFLRPLLTTPGHRDINKKKIYTNTHICIYCIFVCIYEAFERERARERDIYMYIHMNIEVYKTASRCSFFSPAWKTGWGDYVLHGFIVFPCRKCVFLNSILILYLIKNTGIVVYTVPPTNIIEL